ncbi:MAG: response regulator transcription factor [Rhodoglobus sp.]|nr:response regulator transcription factor [Rhodoglobus sp.]
MKLQGKVLLVDDEVHIRKFVALMLQSLGEPVVLQAADGSAALEVYTREKPDLVLLDINMPRVDGIQTLRNLKRADPGCTVVILTSLVNRQTVEECLRIGAAGYLRKDNPPDEMLAQLKKIIGDCAAPKSSPPASHVCSC